jgi:hypothetical protein
MGRRCRSSKLDGLDWRIQLWLRLRNDGDVGTPMVVLSVQMDFFIPYKLTYRLLTLIWACLNLTTMDGLWALVTSYVI